MSQKAEGYMNPDDKDEAGSINLDISVPLHVPGMPSSDRYLKMEQNRRRREKAERVVKKKKEKKRGKHGKKANEIVEEDDEDIVPVHTVEIISEEMPDGAVKTDSEDDQKSYDPHKALDIDLDSPLAASEVLPKPKHRETLKTTTSPTEPSTVEKPKKRKHKKKEKKHKKKHSKHPAESLLVEEEEDGVNGDEKLANGVQQEGGDSPAAAGGKADDLSFWLSNPEETASSPVVN
uniref:AP-3 complex subunit delta domain-containing protein n=1 Tax=Ciona savignyi TaxID=51511 RepID=H2ZNZ8_CIOSA